MKPIRKIAYILPAFGEQPTDAPYRKIATALKCRGFSVVTVAIDWDRRVLTDWIRQAEDAMAKGGPPSLVFGFSFGALVALVCASRRSVPNLVLCSPSPYFAEDVPLLPPIAERVLGKRRIRDFSNYHAKNILPNVRARVRIVVGERDFPLLVKRIARTVKLLPKAWAFTVKGASHDLADPRLLEACLKAIGEIG